MARFSHSQLQVYKQCQLRYRFQYIDKYQAPFEKTTHTLLGTAVHTALEFLYKQVSSYMMPPLEQIQKIMRDVWNDEKNTLMELATPEQEEQFLRRGI